MHTSPRQDASPAFSRIKKDTMRLTHSAFPTFFLLKVILKFLFKRFDIVRMSFHYRIRIAGDHQDAHQGFRIKDASSYFYVNVVIQAFHHIYKFLYTLYFIKL